VRDLRRRAVAGPVTADHLQGCDPSSDGSEVPFDAHRTTGHQQQSGAAIDKAGELPEDAHPIQRAASHLDHIQRSHGATAVIGSPEVSVRPKRRFIAWIPWPEAPLMRLSSAATDTTRSPRTATPTSATFDPTTDFNIGKSCGLRGAVRTRTNGLPT